ncbi:SufS family cysteine desulfurase [Candidatus Roizmanbacteria bacterium]|nr:SufS family cysteine desulfurase [Candidatus Roizmanbacteria bacterium]
MLDVSAIKKDFPLFAKNPSLIYLDSTATALKPQTVIDKLNEYYKEYSANVFRGIYKISERATVEYEKTRKLIAAFIGAEASEVVFTRNTTESLNLVASGLGRRLIGKGDEIVTTIMEHHSNFVPWQQLAIENGGVFKVLDVDKEGKLQSAVTLDEVITKRTKILAVTYVSNVLGVVNPLKKIIARAKKINPRIVVVVDAAQAVPHRLVNVSAIGADFLAFSSHKMLGPTGVGVLWGKRALLTSMRPFQYGGEMIEEVGIEKTTFKQPPHKFEAGTPHIAGVIALQEAVVYLQKIGLESIEKHETELVKYAVDQLERAFGEDFVLLGPRENRTGILSFSLKRTHPHDLAQILDEVNIAIRAGHHCAMPLHRRLGVAASARASFYLYNHSGDVDALIKGLQKAKRILK